MDEPEGFLGRWSRLKRRGGGTPLPRPDEAPAPPVAATGTVGGEPAAHQSVDEPPPLPPIESLGAGSDYTAFLAKGVPEELKRLALRKAWTSDPAIADFRGFGEYDWDFNAPGYGALRATDDLAKLLDAVLKPPPEPEPRPEPEPGSEPEAGPDAIEPDPPLVAAAEPEEPEPSDSDPPDDGVPGRNA